VRANYSPVLFNTHYSFWYPGCATDSLFTATLFQCSRARASFIDLSVAGND